MAKREWMVGQLDRGMGRSSFAVCELSGVPVEATLENVTLQAAAPEMAEMLSDALRWLKGVHDIYGAEALGESKPMNCAGLDEMRDVLKKAGVLE